jgi:hypothetical protein
MGALGQHPIHDLHRLFQPLHALAHGREGPTVRHELLVVPGGPQPDDRAPVGDEVQGGQHLGE